MVLREANGRVGQRGAVADYLDVDPAYERAVEASLGELLQYVIVDRHAQAAEGLRSSAAPMPAAVDSWCSTAPLERRCRPRRGIGAEACWSR